MNNHYYEILGVNENSTDEEITQKYEQLKAKYSEDRFLEGEAGNEAARMLNRIDVAYYEIMSERSENKAHTDEGSSYLKVDELIRAGKFNEAQTALDEFNERPAEWHYLQSVVFYKKNWMNESKKQLEIAIQMDGENTKYRTAYNKLKDKIEFDKRQAGTSAGQTSQTAGDNGGYTGGYNDMNDQQQMGGGFCEQCATCCACNMMMNCCMNACCGCR